MLYLLAYVLFPLLCTCLLFFWVYSLAVRRRAVQGTKRWLFWSQLLGSWQIRIDPYRSPQMLEDVNVRLNTLFAFLSLGGGMAMLLVAVLMACVALITTGTLLVGNSMRGEPFAELVLALLFVGLWLGAMAGFRYIKRSSTHSISFGDLRRRLSADYRSPLLLLPPIIFVAINIVEALISMTASHAVLQVVLMNDAMLQLPTWILLVMPVAMVLMMLMVEGCISSIVRFPRLLVTADLDVAQRVDDMLRALMIGILIVSEYIILGSLARAQSGFLFSVLPQPYLVNVVTTVNLLWMWSATLLCPLLFRQGHVGGRVSGWSGRAMKRIEYGTVTADRQS